MKLALMLVNVDIIPGYKIKPLGYCRPQPVLNSVLLPLVKRKNQQYTTMPSIYVKCITVNMEGEYVLRLPPISNVHIFEHAQ